MREGTPPPARTVSGAVQDTAVMSFLALVSTAVQFLATLFLARALDPLTFGKWQVFMVVMIYVPMLDLGVSTGISRDIPYLIGKKDWVTYRRTAATAFSWCFASAAVIFLLLAGSGAAASTDYLRKGLPLLGLYAVAYSVSSYAQSMLFAHQGLRLASFCNFLRVFLRAVSIVALHSFGPHWILWGWILVEVAVTLFAWRSSAHVRFYWGVDRAVLRRLFRLGFPSFLLGLVAWQTCVGDRAIVAIFLDERSLAYYGLASNLSAGILTLAKQVSQAMHSRILRRYGETQSLAAIRALVLDPCTALSQALPFFIGIGLFAVPLLFHYALPNYLPSISLSLTLIVTTFFVAVPQTQVPLLLALEKQWTILWIWVAGLASNLFLIFLFLKLGLGLMGVAMGTGISWFIVFLTYFAVTLRYHLSARQSVSFVLKLLVPLAYALAVAGVSTLVLGRFVGPLAVLHIGLAVFCLFYLPTLWSLNRKYNVLDSTLKYLHRWRTSPA